MSSLLVVFDALRMCENAEREGGIRERKHKDRNIENVNTEDRNFRREGSKRL